MVNKRKIVDKGKKLALQFSKYSFIGVTATVINIILMWLSVDLFEINSAIATISVVTLVFFYKFYGYVKIGLFHKKIFKFLSVNIVSAILNMIFVWVLIEKVNLSGAVSAGIVVITLFFLRFIIFKCIGIIKE
jgi:putative flippase GtrA